MRHTCSRHEGHVCRGRGSRPPLRVLCVPAGRRTPPAAAIATAGGATWHATSAMQIHPMVQVHMEQIHTIKNIRLPHDSHELSCTVAAANVQQDCGRRPRYAAAAAAAAATVSRNRFTGCGFQAAIRDTTRNVCKCTWSRHTQSRTFDTNTNHVN